MTAEENDSPQTQLPSAPIIPPPPTNNNNNNNSTDKEKKLIAGHAEHIEFIKKLRLVTFGFFLGWMVLLIASNHTIRRPNYIWLILTMLFLGSYAGFYDGVLLVFINKLIIINSCSNDALQVFGNISMKPQEEYQYLLEYDIPITSTNKKSWMIDDGISAASTTYIHETSGGVLRIKQPLGRCVSETSDMQRYTEQWRNVNEASGEPFAVDVFVHSAKHPACATLSRHLSLSQKFSSLCRIVVFAALFNSIWIWLHIMFFYNYVYARNLEHDFYYYWVAANLLARIFFSLLFYELRYTDLYSVEWEYISYYHDHDNDENSTTHTSTQ